MGEGDGLAFAAETVCWFRLEDTSNREITANTATSKNNFLNLSICVSLQLFFTEKQAVSSKPLQNLLYQLYLRWLRQFYRSVSLDTNHLKLLINLAVSLGTPALF